MYVTNLDFSVETSGPSQGRVERVGPIRGAEHNDAASALDAVHQGEERRHHAVLHLVGDVLALRCDGVDLVDEYQRRRVRCGFAENAA